MKNSLSADARVGCNGKLGARALALALVAGCTGETAESQGDVDAPEFPSDSGQAANPKLEYPEGPFGYKKGAVIENFKFKGYANAQVQNVDLEGIELAMFYNPTGDGVYPEGSPFGEGNPKPKALLIDVASVWCGPCNQEAKDVLPDLYAQYKPMGGEFLLQLADGPTPGTAALPTSLRSWTKKYAVDYPATIDPTYKIMALASSDAFPSNFIIDTRTMTIAAVVAGVPTSSFWSKFEQLLAN